MVLGAVPIRPRDGGGQNLDLLRVVVADHQHLGAHFELAGRHLDGRGRSEAQLRGVELEEAEVVHRVPVHGPDGQIIVLVEGRTGPDRAGPQLLSSHKAMLHR